MQLIHSKPGLWAEILQTRVHCIYYCYAIGSGISQISINVLYMHDSMIATQLDPHTGLPTNLSDFLDVCEGEFVGTVEQ